MRQGVGNRQQIHRDERLAEARRTQTLALLVRVEATGRDGTSIEVDGRQQVGNALHDIDYLLRDPSDPAANAMLRILADSGAAPATPESSAALTARLQELADEQIIF